MKNRKSFYCFLILFLLFSSFLSAETSERKNPFLVSFDDSIQSVQSGSSYELKVNFQIPKGFFLYADKTKVELKNLAGLIEVKKIYPKSEKRFDPIFKKDSQVYFESFDVLYQFKVPSNLPLGRITLEGEIRYQGCSDDFCYSPQKVNLLIPIEVGSTSVILNPSTSLRINSVKNPVESTGSFAPLRMTKSSLWSLLKEGKADQLIQLNPFLLLFLVFLGGVLTDLTPCVLPMIPLTLAVIGIQKKRSLLRNFTLSLTLVAGISVTYSILGMISSLFGLRLGFLFQSQYFLGFLILFYLVMALGLLGVFKFQLPLSVRHFFTKFGGDGLFGSFLAGLTLGFIASPCVGPLIGSLLVFVAQSQNLLWGALLLFVYGLGMGTVFLIGGTFYASLGSKIRGGSHAKVIQKILSLILVLPAFYYSYILFSQAKGDLKREGWKSSLQEGFETAKKENKPILIDFYADWCLPCIELDHTTFNDSKVKKELESFVPIKIDCTLENSSCTEAVNRYNVVGWPTILFLDKNQQLQKELSVVGGSIKPERMIELLQKAKNTEDRSQKTE